MSIFAPEKLMAMLGVDPAEIASQIDGFKAGLSQTIVHFNTRLNAVETAQSRIEENLSFLIGTMKRVETKLDRACGCACGHDRVCAPEPTKTNGDENGRYT